MNSNFLNEFIKMKEGAEKNYLDSIVIPIEKQKVIVKIVRNKILK